MNQPILHYLIDNAKLTLEQAQKIEAGIPKKCIPKGTLILQPGEVCQYNLFVESGLLYSYTIGENGKEHIIQFAPEGWIIADRSSLYFNESSKMYIATIEDSQVYYLDDDLIMSLSCQSAEYVKNNNHALHNHIRHLQKRVNQLLGATAMERYLDFIKTYPNLLLRIPQWMVASYLGITPESLSRVRKEIASKSL